MRVDQELSQAAPERDTVLTIGVFDGVHLGHEHLFHAVIAQAEEQGCDSAVVTFRNNPRVVLRPGTEFHYLTSVEERLRLIRETGITLAVPLTFDLPLSQLTAREFVLLLQKHLHMRGMVAGPDFALGHNREGTPQVLTALGEELGFSFNQVSPLMNSDTVVSSTAIRHRLAEGAVGEVASMLGRRFSLQGVVTRGEGRGRGLGFPTANLSFPEDQGLPADGIYATWVHVSEKRYASATSIGVRPTFGEGQRTVEAFLMGFHGDLYDQDLSIEFVRHLRPEQRFDSVEALVAQMHLDVEQARAALAESDA